MRYIEEVVVIGAVTLGVALIAKGESGQAVATFGIVLGYVFGRAQKVNGALRETARK